MECVVKPVFFFFFSTVRLICFNCLITCLYQKGALNLPE